MEPGIASFRQSIDMELLGNQMEMFSEFLSVDDESLNAKQICTMDGEERMRSPDSDSATDPSQPVPSADITDSVESSNPIPDEEYLFDFGGWEVKPWSFAQDIRFQTMSGWQGRQDGWFRKCQALSMSASTDCSEKLYQFLRHKEHVIRTLHKVTLEVLAATIEELEARDKELRSFPTSDIYELCQDMGDIFHRQNQVTFSLHTTPYMRQPWPFQEAVLAEPPPHYKSNSNWLTRSMKSIPADWNGKVGCESTGESRSFGLRRVSSAPTDLLKVSNSFAFERKARIMRWVFSALERLNKLLPVLKKTNSAFRDVLRLIEKEDLATAAWEAQAEQVNARWERVRSDTGMLPPAHRMRWETFFVREADCKACCNLLVLSAKVYYELTGEDTSKFMQEHQLEVPESGEVMHEEFASLLPVEPEFIKSCSAFVSAAREDQILLQMISRALKPVLFSDGQIILKEGTIATTIFLIKHGRCALKVDGHPVMTLRDGDLIGDIEVTRGILRCVDVISEGMCELLQLTRTDLNELLVWYPGLHKDLLQHSQPHLDAVAAVRKQLGYPPLTIPAVPSKQLATLGAHAGSSPGGDHTGGAAHSRRSTPAAEQGNQSPKPRGRDPADEQAAGSSAGGGERDELEEWDGLAGTACQVHIECDNVALKTFRELIMGDAGPPRRLPSTVFSPTQSVPSERPRRNSQDTGDSWIKVVSALRRVTVPAGTCFIKAETAGRCLYIIERGTAEVRVGAETVAVVQVGTVLGEVSLLLMGRRMANVVARTDCTLFQVSHREVARILEWSRTLYQGLCALALRRLSSAPCRPDPRLARSSSAYA